MFSPDTGTLATPIMAYIHCAGGMLAHDIFYNSNYNYNYEGADASFIVSCHRPHFLRIATMPPTRTTYPPPPFAIIRSSIDTGHNTAQGIIIIIHNGDNYQ